eukprot:675204-Hanusia_phi.AAC.13
MRVIHPYHHEFNTTRKIPREYPPRKSVLSVVSSYVMPIPLLCSSWTGPTLLFRRPLYPHPFNNFTLPPRYPPPPSTLYGTRTVIQDPFEESIYLGLDMAESRATRRHLLLSVGLDSVWHRPKFFRRPRKKANHPAGMQPDENSDLLSRIMISHGSAPEPLHGDPSGAFASSELLAGPTPSANVAQPAAAMVGATGWEIRPGPLMVSCSGQEDGEACEEETATETSHRPACWCAWSLCSSPGPG